MTDWREWRDAEPGHFAVLGDPISHSLSPAMHAAGYRAAGLRLSYRAIRVPAGELGRALLRLRDLGYRGVNCTIPLKEEAAEWCRERGGWEDRPGLAPRAGANCIDLRTRRAASTDEAGFLASLPELPDGPALILGAGGSGRALALALHKAGRPLRLWNRTPDRWREWPGLPQEAEILAEPLTEGCVLAVNATSASLAGEPLPVAWSGSGHAIDLAYGRPSPFLESAAAAGWSGQDGRAMLAEQGALAWEWWLGIPAPRKAMIQAIS